jgi:hypothetical protein
MGLDSSSAGWVLKGPVHGGSLQRASSFGKSKAIQEPVCQVAADVGCYQTTPFSTAF